MRRKEPQSQQSWRHNSFLIGQMQCLHQCRNDNKRKAKRYVPGHRWSIAPKLNTPCSRSTRSKSRGGTRPPLNEQALEVEPQLRRVGPRRNKMSTGEGGKKVIERCLVGDVDSAYLQAPLVSVAVEEVVMTYGHIKKMAGCNTGWIVVVIFCARRWNRDACGHEL